MIVVARIKAKAGQEDAMEKAFREMVGKVKEEPGTLAYTLHRAQNDPTVFLFYEKIYRCGGLCLSRSDPVFQGIDEDHGAMMDGAPQIDAYDEVVGLEM